MEETEKENEESSRRRKYIFRGGEGKYSEKENISNEKEKEEDILRKKNCCGRDRWTSKALFMQSTRT